MKAEERKPDEKHLDREKYADIWNQYVALYFFVVCVKSMSKMLSIWHFKKLVASSYDREDFIYGKIN
jgi:hypothetical protein